MGEEPPVIALSQRIVETAWETVRAQAADPYASPPELTRLAGHPSVIGPRWQVTPTPRRASGPRWPATSTAVRGAAATNESQVPAAPDRWMGRS